MILIGCGTTTQIRSTKEASAVPAGNIFYKSEASTNNVIFVRDSGLFGSALTAYLFMKLDPNYERIKLANLEAGELVGFTLKEGEYIFHIEIHPINGQIEDEIFQNIESKKTYYFRIFPISGSGFHIQRTSLRD